MTYSSSLLEINTKNLIYNYKSLSRIAKNSKVGATIKANAYGLGDKKIFDILYKIGCRDFFVATLEEAVRLRSKFLKGNIYILNGVETKYVNILIKNKIIPIINSLENAKKWSKIKKKLKFGIHIDSGINRLGIRFKDLKRNSFNNLEIILLLSHLSSADITNNPYNKEQNNNFSSIFHLFKKTQYKSLSNSMGILLGKNYHYDLIRPGIALYGGHYNTKMKKIIKPVIKLKAKIIQIKNLKKNEYVGYNQTYKTKKSIKVAILSIGYADGVSRVLSNNGCVFYKNKKFNIIGRVSMDSITVDITNYQKKIYVGSFMEIINYKNDIEKIALKCKTISNEILTSIGNRVKRIYL